jgi:hypothetical protein
MTRKEILTLFTAFLLFACTDKDLRSNSYFFGSDTSKLIKETDTTSLYYKNAKQWEHELQLSDLKKGFEGFEMRLWYNPELLLRKKLITIRNFGGAWSAKVYNVTLNQDNENGITAVDSVVALTPKSGWNTFQNKLAELQVKQLPNYTYVRGDELIDDGITYFAEVANRNSYRFSWFSNPQSNIGNSKNSQQWQAVVDLFDQEFEISN